MISVNCLDIMRVLIFQLSGEVEFSCSFIGWLVSLKLCYWFNKFIVIAHCS